MSIKVCLMNESVRIITMDMRQKWMKMIIIGSVREIIEAVPVLQEPLREPCNQVLSQWG